MQLKCECEREAGMACYTSSVTPLFYFKYLTTANMSREQREREREREYEEANAID
jgi:hypothetical protein